MVCKITLKKPLNFDFAPKPSLFFKNDGFFQRLDILGGVITAYFDLMGEHIQINVVSKETLLDAQKNPDNHKNLMVRVAGYSAYFIELDKNVQQDIIDRTSQSCGLGC